MIPYENSLPRVDGYAKYDAWSGIENEVRHCKKCWHKIWKFWHNDKQEKDLCANCFFARK
jgi:hypothetical protein